MATEMDRLEIAIEAQAKGAVSELDKLYASLDKISGALGKVSASKALAGLGSAIGSAASSVASGANKIVKHFTLIGSASSKINKATSSLKGLLGAAIGFYGIRSLVNLGKQAIELSSDLTEVQNVVEHAFGKNGTQVIEDFTKTSIENFGLSELTAKTIASRYQAMGVSMGITGNMIADANKTIGGSMHELYNGVENDTTQMSLNLTKLAADMASFYNKSQEDVATSLSAIYTGQTRPLRQFGLDITQATLSEWAMKQGLDADVQSMTQAQKTMLRYQYVMANTAMVQGDFQRTSFTWANQLRMLRQQFEVLGKTIGEVLINVFRPLITWLNKAMAKVISFAETIANALGKIFGWTIVHTPSGGSMDDLSDSFEGIGDAGEDAADGTKAANKALKEYENTVLGFDELNKLNAVPDNTTGSGSGGSGGSGGTGGVSGASGSDFQIVKTDNLIEKYMSDIQTLFGLGKYISGAIADALESIDWDSIKDKAAGFGTGLASFLNGLITPRLFGDIGMTIAEAINTVLSAENAFLDKFSFTNLGRSLAAGINAFFETYDFDLKAQVFYKAINGLIETIRQAATDIEWYSIGNKVSDCIRTALRGLDWENAYAGADAFGTGLAQALNGLIKPSTFGEVGEAIAKSLNTSLRTLNAWASNFNWTTFGTSLGTGLRRFIRNWDANLTASTFNKLALGILDAAKSAITTVNWIELGLKIRNAILGIEWKTILVSVGDFIMKAINAALDLAKGIFDGTPVVTVIEGLKEDLNEVAGKIDFAKITSGIESIVTALSPAVSGFAQGFTEVFSKLASIGVDILNGIGGALGLIADAIDKMPPEVVESLGEALGKFAAAVAGLKIAGVVATRVESFATAIGAVIGGSGAAAGGAATGGLTGLVSSLSTASGMLSITFPVATYIAIDSLAKLQDKLRGGNGDLSDMGRLIDEMAKDFTPELRDELYELTESFENEGTSSDEAAKKLAAFFINKGIDPTKIEGALRRAQGELNQTGGAVDYVEEALKIMADQGVTTASELAMTKSDYDGFKEVLKYLASEGIIPNSEKFEELDNMLKQETGAGTAKDAFDKLKSSLYLTEEQASTLDTMMREKVPSAFSSVDTSTTNTTSYMSNLMGTLGELKNKGIDLTQTGFGGLLGSILGIGSNAEDADTKSASLKDLIWKFAGGIGAQAILMAVAGTTFKTMGDKSETAGEKVSGMKDNIDELSTYISDNRDTMQTNTEYMFEGATNGAETGMAGLSSVVLGGLGTMNSSVEELEGINSPSTVWAGYGYNLIKGMENGWQMGVPTMLGEITSALTEMGTQITNEYQTFNSYGATIAENFKSGLTSISLSDVVYDWTSDLDFQSFNTQMLNAGANAVTSFGNGMRRVSLPLPHLNFDYWVKDTGSGYNYGYNTSIDWYALGGFPNMGDLFWAGENGPEMVGRMGGHRNAVVNNAQITESIRAAVVDGMVEAAMAGAFGGGSGAGNDGTPLVLNATIKTPDGDVLARVVERAQARRNSRFNPVAASV